MKNEDVIKDFINDFETGPHWEKQPNIMLPPLHCMETYWKCTSEITKVRITSLLPFGYEQMKNYLKEPYGLSSCYSMLDSYKYIDENTFEIQFAKNFYSKIVKCEMYFEENSYGAFLVYCNIVPKEVISHFHFVKKMKDGIKYVIETDTITQHLNKKLFYELANYQRKLIHFSFELLNNDVAGRKMVELELKFIRSISNTIDLPIIAHKNKLFTIWVSEDFSEICLKGKGKFRKDFQSIVNTFYQNNRITYLFPVNNLIKENDRISVYHRESPYFCDSVIRQDEMVGSTIVEGSIFLGSQSITYPDCPFCVKYKSNFKTIIAGEKLEWSGDCAESIYYYHWLVPELKSKSLKLKRVCINNLIITILLLRSGIEYDIIPSLYRIENPILLSNSWSLLLSCIKMKNDYLKYKIETEHQQITPMKSLSLNDKFLFNELNEKLVVMILLYLPLEEVIKMERVNKRLLHLIKESSILQLYYDSLYNRNTFKKHPDPSITQEQSPLDYSVDLKWKYTMYDNWKNKRFYQRQHFDCLNYSIDYLKLFQCQNSVFIGSKEGKIHEISLESCNVKYSYPILLPLSCISVNNNENNLVCVTQTGIACAFDLIKRNDCKKFPSQQYNDCKIDLSHQIYGLNKNGFCVSKLGTTDIIAQYQFSKINAFHEVDQNLFALSINKRIELFDSRIQQISIKTSEQISLLTSICGFDNYIIVGSESGTIKLFDIRSLRLQIDRLSFCCPITTMDCFNRKLVIGGKSGFLSFFECNHGWFGKMNLLYSHYSPVTSTVLNDQILVSGSSDGNVYYTDFA